MIEREKPDNQTSIYELQKKTEERRKEKESLGKFGLEYLKIHNQKFKGELGEEKTNDIQHMLSEVGLTRMEKILSDEKLSFLEKKDALKLKAAALKFGVEKSSDLNPSQIIKECKLPDEVLSAFIVAKIGMQKASEAVEALKVLADFKKEPAARVAKELVPYIGKARATSAESWDTEMGKIGFTWDSEKGEYVIPEEER